MSFQIYNPENLTFNDYVNVCQCSRTLADGYDRKDKSRLRAALAPNVVIDYSLVVAAWGEKHFTADAFVEEWLSYEHLGKKVLATQHLFGIPYFQHVTADKIVIEYAQLASHGRRAEGEDYEHPMSKIGESSDGRGWVQHTLIKIDGQWRISVIKPEAIYHTGDFQRIRRSEDMA